MLIFAGEAGMSKVVPAWARGGEVLGDGESSGGAISGHEIPA